MTGLVVGVDVATAAVRAQAVDGTGARMAFAEEPLASPSSPRPGWSEQDASSWWPATVRVLARLTCALGKRASSIAAMSVSATSGTVVALDSSGRPCGPALTYADQRAGGEAAIARAAAAESWKTMGLTIAPSFGLPKWAWMLRHLDGPDHKVTRLVHASDLLVEALVGHPVPTDWSHALKSGWDPIGEDWVAPALDALEIPRHLLPEVLCPGTPVGRIHGKASAATGMPAGCVVHLGMTDSCASQLATGAAKPGHFVSVLGTTLVIKSATTELVSDPAGVIYSHRHPGGWWLPGGASNTGGRALQVRFPGADLPALDRAAAERGPACMVTYPLVGQGERFPFSSAEARGFSLGQPADEVELYRSLLEGVAFVERLGYERFRSLGAEPTAQVIASGRASASPVWNAVRAAVLGTCLLAKPQAGTCLGACMLAAAGTLHPDLASASEAMSPRGTEFEPDPRESRPLDEGYRRFRAALQDRGLLDPA